MLGQISVCLFLRGMPWAGRVNKSDQFPFIFMVVTNRRVFLLCELVGSNPPWNHLQDQGSIRVDKHYV